MNYNLIDSKPDNSFQKMKIIKIAFIFVHQTISNKNWVNSHLGIKLSVELLNLFLVFIFCMEWILILIFVIITY